MNFAGAVTSDFGIRQGLLNECIGLISPFEDGISDDKPTSR